jgi:hypothetical protein
VGLIQNAALDHANSLWPFPINEGCPAIAEEIQGLAKGHPQIMSEQEDFIKPEIWKILNLFSGVPEEENWKVKRIRLYFA